MKSNNHFTTEELRNWHCEFCYTVFDPETAKRCPYCNKKIHWVSLGRMPIGTKQKRRKLEIMIKEEKTIAVKPDILYHINIIRSRRNRKRSSYKGYRL